jgi:hypothetical protein
VMRSTSIRSAVVTFAAGTLMAGCAPVTPAQVTPVQSMDPQDAVTVLVTATGCGTDHVTLAVDPWEARVRRGQEVQWPVPAEADSMRIVPKEEWPFPAPPATALRRGVVQSGTLQASTAVERRYRYSAVLYCGARVIDLDPVVLQDPD